jgi:hypothetical protein
MLSLERISVRKVGHDPDDAKGMIAGWHVDVRSGGLDVRIGSSAAVLRGASALPQRADHLPIQSIISSVPLPDIASAHPIAERSDQQLYRE